MALLRGAEDSLAFFRNQQPCFLPEPAAATHHESASGNSPRNQLKRDIHNWQILL
jgi:hypothetical protein